VRQGRSTASCNTPWVCSSPRFALRAANGESGLAPRRERSKSPREREKQRFGVGESEETAEKTRDGRAGGALSFTPSCALKSVVDRILSEFDDLVGLHRRARARRRSGGDAM
jgi:hypothetical protein